MAAPAAGGARNRKSVNLALQGGGSHGAFTWGVLDRLLEDGRLAIDGLTATSAGAMNAAALTCGLSQGGAMGARDKLESFWRRISELGQFAPLQPNPLDRALGNWNLDHSPAYLGLDLISRVLSPYQLNPFNYNPLREVLEAEIDIDCLHGASDVQLFVAATSVRTGKLKVFRQHEVTIDALLASACLPQLFQAVWIDGEPFWDGGFTGNPALHPLFYNCTSQDILVVQVNPLEREDLPTSARDILDRVNEISFNSSLMRDMRAIEFVSRMMDEGRLDRTEYKQMYIHLIEAAPEMGDLGFSSKLVTDWKFLTRLRDLGRTAAGAWLDAHGDDVGERSSVEIRDRFL